MPVPDTDYDTYWLRWCYEESGCVCRGKLLRWCEEEGGPGVCTGNVCVCVGERYVEGGSRSTVVTSG